MKLKQITTLILSLALLAANVLGAGVPRLIPYQGRLTDAADVPVTDGAHLVKFIIYNGATLEARELWNSQYQSVTTTDGLFEYNLGSVTPISEELFLDTLSYLGITIGADPEISPRTRFATTPYAFQALFAVRAEHAASADIATNVPWSGINNIPAGFADGTDNVNTDWDSLTNIPPGFADGTDDNSGGDITGVTAGSGLSGGGASGTVTLRIPTDGVNSNMIANSSITSDDIATDAVGSIQIQVNAVGSAEVINNSLTASDLASNSVTAAEMGPNSVGASEMQSNAIGTFEVIDNSLSSADLADEPGLAHTFSNVHRSYFFPKWGNLIVDSVILSQSIDCPTTGYVIATATGYFFNNHSVGSESWCRAMLTDEDESKDFDNFAWFSIPSTAPSGEYSDNWSITKVTSVIAETKTFYLKGSASAANVMIVGRPHLTLLFVPTAYGTVTNSSPPVSPQGPAGVSE